MLGLPESTAFNKRIPKEKFYEKLDVAPALKKCFVDQVKVIYWRNKIAATTMNLLPGNTVTEIEVFEVKLKTPHFDETILRQIDKGIPYHILFLVEYDGKYQAWTAYKEATAKDAAFKVNHYYHTDWLTEETLPLKLNGLNIDTVYENFVYQIAGDALQATEKESLQDAVARDEKKKQLRKQIERLNGKIRKETQLNIQMKLNQELKALKRELETL